MKARYIFAMILFIIGLIFVFAASQIYFMKPPEETCGKYGCALAPKYFTEPPGLCLWVKETFFDKSIPAPTAQPYLGGFYAATGGGPPFCAPVWYAYRYVKNSDGRYGPLSPWTGSDSPNINLNGAPAAIYAGVDSSKLPCLPGGCSQVGIPGNTCDGFNQPKIVLVESITNIDTRFGQSDAWENGYTLNVHRQVGTGFDANGEPLGFDPKSEGIVIGTFYIAPGVSGTTAFCQDVVSNPNVTNMGNCC